MAALTTTTISRAGVAMPFTAAAGGGDTFTNTGAEFFHVSNSSGGAITVTFTTSITVDSLAVTDLAVSVADSANKLIGPFPRYIYGSTVSVAYSGVSSVTVGVFKLTPETT